MFVYVKSEPTVWTVGHYRPDGEWEPESDQASADDAAKRVRWLNGGNDSKPGDLGDIVYAGPQTRPTQWPTRKR